MTGVIRLHAFGGPEVLRFEQVELPAPGDGEVLIRQTAIGLNFIDTYHRSGLYPLALPAVIGTEAAGVVEAAGRGVAGIKVGDYVAYTGMPPGAYAEKRIYPAERLVKLPATMPDEIAATLMLKGLTAWYLLRRSYVAKAGEPVLVYAAAGATGALICQWAASLGCVVIGVVGSAAKVDLARENGCQTVVIATDPAFVARVREASGGGCAAVYDSVGKDTFLQSLDCLRKHGTMVSFGNASGPVAPFAPAELAKRGSLYLTRPSLFDFIGTRAELTEGATELFAAVAAGAIRARVSQRYPLRDAAAAHRDLEARRTTGASILVP